MFVEVVVASLTAWMIPVLSQNGIQTQSYRQRPQLSTVNWNTYSLPPYGSYGPYGGFCCFTININMPPNPPGPSPGPPPPPPPPPLGPLAILPNGSMILPGGSLRFPNSTVVLTQYASGVIPPAGRLPSGRIIFANNTILGPGIPTSFPPPGFPLMTTIETNAYPPLFLPNRTLILYNGTLLVANGAISTVFMRGFNPNCGGLTCHFFVPNGKK